MDFVRAAQPRVVLLFLLTALAAMLLAGMPEAWLATVVLGATALTVGGAALVNNALEWETDRRMQRTSRRPTASGRIPPARALAAGLIAVAAGSLALWATAGGLAALFALLGAVYYMVVYTLVLKPRTALSAVPGGVAGIFPALIGWAATGHPWSAAILFLCLVIPVWSPPHSWALTLALADDYRLAGIPTPAVTYGEQAARLLIAGFVVLLSAVIAAPLIGDHPLVYALGAGPAAALLWVFTARLLIRHSRGTAWALFKVSGPCLALILAGAVAAQLS